MRKIISVKYLIAFFFLFPVFTSAQIKKPAVKKPAVKSKPKTVSKPPIKKDKNTVVNKILPSKTIIQPVKVPVVTLTSRELEMINEINILRTDPLKYYSYTEIYLQTKNISKEEKEAVKEVQVILKKMKPLNALTVNMAMYNDAKQFGFTLIKADELMHSSLPYSENLSLGHKEIKDAILDLLIDHGIPDRGHRKNLLNPNFKQLAVVELPGKIDDIPYCYIQEFK